MTEILATTCPPCLPRSSAHGGFFALADEIDTPGRCGRGEDKWERMSFTNAYYGAVLVTDMKGGRELVYLSLFFFFFFFEEEEEEKEWN